MPGPLSLTCHLAPLFKSALKDDIERVLVHIENLLGVGLGTTQPEWYVNSVTGNDDADATTPATALKTLAALDARMGFSTTLAGINKVGVLGGSIAFTRPDAGNGCHGGPIKIGGNYVATQRPLGIFINDAVGNAYENTPGPASYRGPYVKGQSTVGVMLWETQQQIGGFGPLSYAVGNRLYASVNGLLTNRIEDAYEYRVVMDPDNVTIMGVLRVMPDAANTFLVVDLRV